MRLAVAGLMAYAAASARPILGKWKLDVSKSTFLSGPAPKSQSLVFITDTTRPRDGVLRLVIDQAGANGATQTASTFRSDGKRYPVKGSKDVDALEATETSGFEGQYGFQIRWSQQGSPLFVCNAFISRSGDVLTIVTAGTGGSPFTVLRVFERAR